MAKQLLILLLLLNLLHVQGQVSFPYRFNPIGGLLSDIEKGERDEMCLNGTWEFMPIYENTKESFTFPDKFIPDSVLLKIPSPWNVNSFTNGEGGDFITYPSYPEKWERAQIGWMRKEFVLESEWLNKSVSILFQGVLGHAKIYLNGQYVGENFELFLPFEFDITPFLKPGKNELLVGVCKASLYDQKGQYGYRTYVGGSMWGKEMVGIWQDIYLLSTSSVHISDLFVKPFVSEKKLVFDISIDNTTSSSKKIKLKTSVSKWINMAGRSVIEAPVEKGCLSDNPVLSINEPTVITVPANSKKTISLQANIDNDQLLFWDINNPNLYGAVVQIFENNKILDTKYERFGWREFKIIGNDLTLNGKKICLKGDSWHFMGIPQMTRRYAWAWYNMLKDANANAVRLHAQPYPEFYLDMADEMGICVLDETGIWSSDGGPKVDSDEYWDNCNKHLKGLINRDKNHPSVFGWSVCNEVIPVVTHVYNAPERIIQKQVDELNKWVDIAKNTDPTRNWISGDGETQRPTQLPTLIGHYGDERGMMEWASQNKPWGIGETSMAYYGTPLQISKMNGDRAFENVEGRMEGLAKECYNLLRVQQKYGASYQSVFNLVWYSLKPLALGKSNLSCPPSKSDGVLFSFEEGMPGVQPERLGAYTTTLNPGYDNSKALYEPWPMFYAVKAANGGEIYEPTNNVLRKFSEKRENKIDKIILATPNSKIADDLRRIGVPFTITKSYTPNTMIFVDGSEPMDEEALEIVRKGIKANSLIFVMGLSEVGENMLNSVLPDEISLYPYNASSLVIGENDAVIGRLKNKDFYFSEILEKGKSMIKYVLEGDFVKLSTSLLLTCKADWQKWNYCPETSKTASLFRSEFERRTELPVMIHYNKNGSNIYINTLDYTSSSYEMLDLLKRMFDNLGVQFSNNNQEAVFALDHHNALKNAMHFNVNVKVSAGSKKEILKKEYLNNETKILSDISGNKSWNLISADSVGRIHLTPVDKEELTIHYLSFWLFSPRSLSDLLIEPNMPRLSLFLESSDYVLWLNNNEIKVKNGVVDSLPLDKGWNNIRLKIVQMPNEDKTVRLKLESDSEKFISEIGSSYLK